MKIDHEGLNTSIGSTQGCSVIIPSLPSLGSLPRFSSILPIYCIVLVFMVGLVLVLGLAHSRFVGRVARTNECLRSHDSGDVEVELLLVLGAQKILKNCCTPSVACLHTKFQVVLKVA